ncbi:MAG: hypothetical protein V2B18_02075 [Pseudomonadota bacterium]
MMSDWEFFFTSGGSDQPVDTDYRNVVGTPLRSVVRLEALSAGSAPLVAGVYRFTLETGSTVRCDVVHPHDLGNPLFFEGTKEIIADGATPNAGLLPGLGLVFAADVSPGDAFEIGVGAMFGSQSGEWTRVLTWGPVCSGAQTSYRWMKVRNAGNRDWIGCRLTAGNAARIVNGQAPSRPVHSYRQTGNLNPSAHSDAAGRSLTFVNFTSGSPNTTGILVDGSFVEIRDVAAAEVIPGTAGLKCDGLTVYRFADGTPYQSIEFILSPELSASDTAAIRVYNGGECIELADALGLFQPGPTGITLKSGAVEGLVAGQAAVPFRIRASVPPAALPALNPMVFSLRVTGTEV